MPRFGELGAIKIILHYCTNYTIHQSSDQPINNHSENKFWKRMNSRVNDQSRDQLFHSWQSLSKSASNSLIQC